MIIATVIMVAALLYVGRTFHWEAIARGISHINLALFLVSACCSIVSYWWVRTLRWSVLLYGFHAGISFWTLYLTTALSVSLATITPLQAGEFCKVELLTDGATFTRASGYSTFVVERAMDGAIVGVLAAIGLCAWNPIHLSWQVALPLAAGAVLVIAAVAHLAYHCWPARMTRLFAAFALLLRQPARLAAAFALSLLAWGLIGAGWHYSLQCVGIAQPPLTTFCLMGMLTIINIASLIPGAIGVAEVGAVAILTHFGEPRALAQIGAIALRLYGLMTILLGVLHYPIWRLNARNARADTLPQAMIDEADGSEITTSARKVDYE